MSDPKTDGTSIQVLARMFALLEALARDGEAVSLKWVSEQTQLHPSTAHRILNDLAVGGFVERCGPGAYRLGLRLIALGNLVRSRLDVRELAMRPMQDLHRITGLTCALFLRQDDEALCVERTVVERGSVQVHRGNAYRWPLTLSAAGKVLVLQESSAVLRAMCAAQGARYESLQADLSLIRQHHLATEDGGNESTTPYVVCPIWDDLGGVKAGLALMAANNQAIPAEAIESLRSSAARICAALGAWQEGSPART